MISQPPAKKGSLEKSIQLEVRKMPQEARMSEHLQTVSQLETKLRTVEELEKVVAPKGVNFSLRGQEDVTGCVPWVSNLRDPLAAADAVIAVLTDAKQFVADKETLLKSAIRFPTPR